jgi:hypothetical protein
MSEKQLKPRQYLTFYLLWIASGILCVFDALATRSAITAIAAAMASAIPMEIQIQRQWYLRWPVRAVNQFAWAIVGIGAVVAIMALDYVYRTAILKGVIKKRFATVTAIQVGILIVAEIVNRIASSTL